MMTVKLYGEAGKRFGRVHRFDIRTPAEAVRALCANFEGFERYMSTAHERGVGFRVITGGEELESVERALEPASKEVKIIPAIIGASAGARIIIGAALIVAGAVASATGVGAGAAPYLINIGIGLALGGVIQLLSPTPKINDPQESPENTPSYLFNGAVNTTAQGHPVPVAYGRLIVGGALISAGISVQQIQAGFRRVSSVVTVDIDAYGNEEGYQSAPPANYFRRDLLSTELAQPGGYDYPITVYHYRFYYYEWSLVPE